ncbi:hypothetical protein [Paenibacillus sp. DMB5]|uniref:hypothetical protein n=1 Tax=Paenibacillus sp. DMB5 TaxID=1780103 RepID=UPI000837B2CC|nr:hypothetical protein [Paenibacillus sp. DMB5]
MAKRKTTPKAEQVAGASLSAGSVLLWRATRPLTVQEHADLSDKLRHEAEATGINIVLVPFTVEPEAGDTTQEPASPPDGDSPPADPDVKADAADDE